jgi:signal transduction histidine kinase
MLQIYNVDTDVRAEAQKVISIFQNEARMKRIALSLSIGESITRLGIHHIKTDPVRLGQVSVEQALRLGIQLMSRVTNLLSNGIRFTSNSCEFELPLMELQLIPAVRKIELKFDLSFEPPVDDSCLMPRLPERPAELKDDVPIFLYVAVTDTGPGLTAPELELLFQRFSQVSRQSTL